MSGGCVGTTTGEDDGSRFGDALGVVRRRATKLKRCRYPKGSGGGDYGTRGVDVDEGYIVSMSLAILDRSSP